MDSNRHRGGYTVTVVTGDDWLYKELGGIRHMSIQIRERDVESYLVNSCERDNLPCIKFASEHRIGMPDRLILLPDQRCIWVELKTKGGHLAEIQKLQHRRLEQAGQRVVVIWTKKDVDRLMREICPVEEDEDDAG